MRRRAAFRPGSLDVDILERRVVLSQIHPLQSVPATTVSSEVITTKFSDGGQQTTNRTDTKSGNLTTTNETITERDGSVETITDVAVANGHTTTYNETTLQPDGKTKTETGTNVRNGNTTTFNRIIQVPGSPNPETITGTTVTVGITSNTNETITETDGAIEQLTETTIRHSARLSTETATTTYASGMSATVKSTIMTRVV